MVNHIKNTVLKNNAHLLKSEGSDLNSKRFRLSRFEYQEIVDRIFDKKFENSLSCKDDFLSNSAYFDAYQLYEEGVVNHRDLPIHVMNQLTIHCWLSKLLKEDHFSTLASSDLQIAIASEIKNLILENKIILTIYNHKFSGCLGYGKFLLYSHVDQENPFCLQLFAFSAGQKTPIHDHPCECLSYVVKGELKEEVYLPVHENRLTLYSEQTRHAPSIEIFDENHLNYPHRLINDHYVDLNMLIDDLNFVRINIEPSSFAYSIHLYNGMNGAFYENNSVTERREDLSGPRIGNSAVAKIYG